MVGIENTASSKFDDVFMGMLQHCGKIEPFLDIIFNFLARRTDFFLLMHKRDDKQGFPPGVAEKMLIAIFEKYQEKVLKNDSIYMKWKENQRKGKETTQKKCPSMQDMQPKVVEVEEMKCVEIEENKSKVVEMKEDEPKVQEANQICEEDIIQDHNKNLPKANSTIATQITSASTDSNPITASISADSSNSKNTVDDDCFNGGKTDAYSWSQSISDVDLKIPIPPFLKTSKDLSIEILHESINVSLKRDPPPNCSLDGRVILAGKLKERIRVDESMWSLIPGDHIAVNLEKFQQKWWEGLFEGSAEIDRATIDTTQHVQDFDEQTQSDIRKVMYDQQQKLMGKPTSDEQKTHELLEKAWDAEGSPFKGTPFDPSSVNISGDMSGLQ